MATQHIPGRLRRTPSVQPVFQPQQKQGFAKTVDRAGDFLLNYWAHIVTIGLGLLVLAALSIPFLSYFGLDEIAKPLFFFLHYFCAQIPSHSFYIFGHQLGFCARNFSIYTSMFLGSLAFILSKKRLPGIPWWIWLLMISPMAWDGLTQMFGLRESDWILRTITGTLFGLGNIWFVLPLMQKSLLETVPYIPQYANHQQVTMQHANYPDAAQDNAQSDNHINDARLVQTPTQPTTQNVADSSDKTTQPELNTL